jgi:hypothetical protein
VTYAKPDIQKSGYPVPGYFRICVFSPEDESYGLPTMDRLFTKEQIEKLDMTGLILDRITQREEPDKGSS